MAPVETLDAVHRDYDRIKAVTPFDTAFTGHRISNDSSLSLHDWLIMVEECLDAEKKQEYVQHERKEYEKQLKRVAKLKEDEERENEEIRERAKYLQKDRNVVDQSMHKSKMERSSSNAIRDTESSRRRSNSVTNKGSERSSGSNYGKEKEKMIEKYLRNDDNYSICDARAHAISFNSESGIRGGLGLGSRMRPRSASVTSGTKSRITEKNISIGRESYENKNKYENKYENKSGNVNRNRREVNKFSNSGCYSNNSNNNSGNYMFADSNAYCPSVRSGMMKTRVGQYAYRQKDKQQQQQQHQQLYHKWNIEDFIEKPTLVSKGNRAFKLRQQNAFVVGCVDGITNPRSTSPQYDNSQIYNHQAWIRYASDEIWLDI